MKREPPFLTDDEADKIWRQGNQRTFGVEATDQATLTTPQLRRQINDLQHELYLRTESDARASSDSTLPFNSLAERLFRQGKRSDISDKNAETGLNQSKTTKDQILKSSTVFSDQIPFFGTNKTQIDQSSSSEDPHPNQSDIVDQGTVKDKKERARKRVLLPLVR
jgi:hypothetical protein